MIKRLAIWYLLRRARNRKEFYTKEMVAMSPVSTDEWIFQRVSELRANNYHVERALNSIKELEGT